MRDLGMLGLGVLVALCGCDVGQSSAISSGGAVETEGDQGDGDDDGDGGAQGGNDSNGAEDEPLPGDDYVRPDYAGTTPVEVHGQLSIDGQQLVDQDGELVQLKGPSSMWLNWENTGYASDPQGVQFIRDNWGATVIRASMGVEPGGAYLSDPAKSLADVRAVIDTAIGLGMYVIIDWHDHNAHMNQAEAVEFFTMMAEEYGETPNVLYEPFNEPLEVDWSTVVKPYHEAVVKAIRAVDPDNVIILGTPRWSQDVERAALDPVEGDNLMYTVHFYSCTHGIQQRQKAKLALDSGLAIFVTEWGATHADGGTPENPSLCEDKAQDWIDFMDDHVISWAAWKLDDCVDISCFFTPGTPTSGGWADSELNGHGAYVVARMRE